MAVKTTIDYTEGLYFITFTCQDWLSLFEITNSYDAVYKWFDHLKSKGHFVKAYVIMPNHLHVLIDFGKSAKSINTIASNGKRFMAYTIVEKLKEQNHDDILKQLSEVVNPSDKTKERFTRYLNVHLIAKKLHLSISLCRRYLTYTTILAMEFGNLLKIPLIIYIARQNIIRQENREVILSMISR